MAGGIDWFRWHHGSVTDPKFQLIARKSGASLPDVLAVWAYLLESASASNDRGSFGEIDAEALDCLFGFPDTETRTADIIAAMRDRNLLQDDRVEAWDRRQPKRERESDDTAAERKRLQRAREARDVHVTPCHAMSHQETPREEESRGEEITSKPLNSKTETTQRASRLPADWTAPSEYIEFCKQERPDLDPIAMQDKFRDYWTDVPGKQGLKVNWIGTWRNFVRSERATPQARGSPGKTEKFDPVAHVNRNRIQP